VVAGHHDRYEKKEGTLLTELEKDLEERGRGFTSRKGEENLEGEGGFLSGREKLLNF